MCYAKLNSLQIKITQINNKDISERIYLIVYISLVPKEVNTAI